MIIEAPRLDPMPAPAIWQKLKNGDYPIITLEWRRLQRRMGRQVGGLCMVAVLWALGALGATNGLLAPGGLGQISYLVMFSLAILWLVRYATVGLVIPTYAARSIAFQRETHTLEMLALTPMSSRSIIGQVLSAGAAQALAATVAAAPAIVAVWMMSPSARAEVFPFPCLISGIGGEIVFWAAVALNGSIGVFWSCMCSKSQNAVSLTVLFVLFLVPCLAIWLADRLISGLHPAHRIGYGPVVATAGITLVSLGLATLCACLAVLRLGSLRHSLGGAR